MRGLRLWRETLQKNQPPHPAFGHLLPQAWGRKEQLEHLPLQHAFTCEPFSNLVQHNLLIDDGVSFRLERDPAEADAKTDFFASEDRWCRPVMVRTGPDGALWVVDMYRYMIEHPHWLPKEGQDELRPFFRSGDDRGRIYRIVPVSGTAPAAGAGADASKSGAPRSSALSSTGAWTNSQLRNSSQNSKVRMAGDAIQPSRLLVTSRDESAAELLRTMVSSRAEADSPAACTVYAGWPG